MNHLDAIARGPTPFMNITPAKFCRKFHPPKQFKWWAGKYPTMNEAWEQCDNPEWMFWILEKFGETSKLDAVAIAILFACSILHLAKDDSAVEAILAAEKWRLDPSKINSDLAYSASKAAYNAGNRTDVCDYPSAACLFAAFRAAATAWACGHANANFWGHVDSCATAVRWTAKNSEERANINKANCQIVREVVANPFL